MKRILPSALILAFAAACSNEPQQAGNYSVTLSDPAPGALSPEDLAALKAAAEADPANPAAQEAYAAALLVGGKAGEALKRLEKLPPTPQRSRLSGDALVMSGRYRDAVRAFRAAGDFGDTPLRLTETLRLVGAGAIEGKRWREATAVYEELRARGDRDPLVLNNLAYAYGALKAYDQAIPFAREAVKQSPESPAALDTLGWLLFESKRDEAEGRRLIAEAARLSPQDAAIAAHARAAGLRSN